MTFHKIIHFSDGCPYQYKGKTSFVDVTFATEDTGIPTEKHFFGSRHRKGPCDREIGVVKRMAKLAVLRRQCVIYSAQDMYDFACGNLTRPDDGSHSHNCRQFRFVPVGAICRDSEERTARTSGKGIDGTRKLHCVRGHAPFIASHRERSCFCEACITSEGECPNIDFVGSWTEVSMKVNRRKKRNVAGVQPESGRPEDNSETAGDAARTGTVTEASEDAARTGTVTEASEDAARTGTVTEASEDAARTSTVTDRGTVPGVQPENGRSEDNTEPIEDASSVIRNRCPKVDDFVTAVFKTGRKQTETLYYAKVLEVLDDKSECHLHYLAKKDGHYVWADKAWHPTGQIKDVVAPPTLVPGRKLAFSFE